jgi:hypothetical protein
MYLHGQCAVVNNDPADFAIIFVMPGSTDFVCGMANKANPKPKRPGRWRKPHLENR